MPEAARRVVAVPFRGACGVAALWPDAETAVGVAAVVLVDVVPVALGEAREELLSLERLKLKESVECGEFCFSE